MCIFFVLLQLFRSARIRMEDPVGPYRIEAGNLKKKNLTVNLVVQFDQRPEASWAGFWAPGASWARFLAPKSLPGGRAGTPPQKDKPDSQLSCSI